MKAKEEGFMPTVTKAECHVAKPSYFDFGKNYDRQPTLA
jgi:hypothetical protein